MSSVVGTLVHYIHLDTGFHHAGIIIKQVGDRYSDIVYWVANGDGTATESFVEGADYSELHENGTWHWPHP